MKFHMERCDHTGLVTFRGSITQRELMVVERTLSPVERAICEGLEGKPAADHLLALELLFRRHAELTSGDGSATRQRCDHTLGRSEPGGITRCQACGEISHRTEHRPCGDCKHCVDVLTGHICNHHLSAIGPSNRAGYSVAKGTCWQPRDSTTRQAPSALPSPAATEHPDS